MYYYTFISYTNSGWQIDSSGFAQGHCPDPTHNKRNKRVSLCIKNKPAEDD